MRGILAVVLIMIVVASGCIGAGTSPTTPTESPEKESTYSTANDVLDPTETEYAMNVVDASNAFGIELYRELSGGEGNVFVSPFSVFTALSMAYEGALGKTAREMAEVLHLPRNETLRREGLRTILLHAERPSGLNLRIANALWVQRGYPPREDYITVIERYYLGDVREVDFKGDTRGAERIINGWVENETNGRIKNLVGGLTPDTRLVITNAVYFKANWTLRFSPSETHNDTFTLPSGRKVIIPMMTRLGRFNYAETDEFQAVELPYEGSRFSNFSMVIILPKKTEGLGKIEEKLSPRFLQAVLSSLKPEEVEVTIPKFKFEGDYHLVEILEKMGMREAFTNRADFSGISPEPLSIGSVVHKTFIKVAENGTEAAAATVITMTMAMPSPEYKVFKADHPFLFFIVDRDTGLVLFMGRLEDPRG